MCQDAVNSTPHIMLCNAGHIDLLHDLYGEVSIPHAVFAEVTRNPRAVPIVEKDSGYEKSRHTITFS